MPFWKVLALSVAGFTVPVIVAVLASPVLFNHVNPEETYTRGWLTSAAFVPAAGFGSVSLPPIENGSPEFRSLPSREGLDPRAGTVFVASAVVRFAELPEIGARQRVFYKYASSSWPYPGWGLAVRRLPASLRPEVYWQGSSGEGGWYTFGDIEISTSSWYSFSFLVQDGSYLSLYWEKLGEVDGQDSGKKHRRSAVRYSGGFQLDDIDSPRTDAPLQVAPASPEAAGGAVFVSSMLVAHIKDPPKSMKSAFALLDGGALKIAQRLRKTQVGLWLGTDGSGGNEIAFSGLPPGEVS